MDKVSVKQQIESLGLSQKVEMENIPSIDLYMDQVITFFDKVLGHTKRYEEDKLLTKTMINNYTKDKLLMPAVKKKYTREHIMLMILLYNLKQVLSIADIKQLFDVVIQEDSQDSRRLTEIYKLYIKCKQKAAEDFSKQVEETIDSLSREIKSIQMDEMDKEMDKIEDMMLVILLSEQASYYKRLAEKIIDIKIKRENTKTEGKKGENKKAENKQTDGKKGDKKGDTKKADAKIKMQKVVEDSE